MVFLWVIYLDTSFDMQMMSLSGEECVRCHPLINPLHFKCSLLTLYRIFTCIIFNQQFRCITCFCGRLFYDQFLSRCDVCIGYYVPKTKHDELKWPIKWEGFSLHCETPSPRCGARWVIYIGCVPLSVTADWWMLRYTQVRGRLITTGINHWILVEVSSK